ncbi:MAG: ATP:cob(I)alamin adenosyltransferase [Bacilli bacterium]|nr:ATP:cob(I)alamin adenosyltransferase [Bacilli bacterium]
MKSGRGKGDKGQVKYCFGDEYKGSNFVNLIGSIDGLMSHIAFLCSLLEDDFYIYKSHLLNISRNLSVLAGELATKNIAFDEENITTIEHYTDELESNLPRIKKFVSLVGTKSSSYAHVVRSQVRKTERDYFIVMQERDINPLGAVYLNRLSDYFFALARTITNYYKVEEYL